MQNENQLISGEKSLSRNTIAKLEAINYQNIEAIPVHTFEDYVANEKLHSRISTVLKYDPNGEKKIIAVLAGYLVKIENLTGVKRFVSDEGVKFLFSCLQSEFPHLTLTDLKMFAEMVIKLRFGEAYENISAQKLYTWLCEYDTIRTNTIRDVKIAAEKKEYESGGVDHAGLRRMADAFGKIHRKHIAKRDKKKDTYTSIQDYIDRNNLDEPTFWANRNIEFDRFLEDYVASSDSGITKDQLEQTTTDALRRIYLMKFLNDQNDLL